MAGILDWFSRPENQGLLNLSAGLLQAGGPSPTPVGFGQALGQGMQQGIRGFQGAQQMQMQQQLMGLKQAEMKKQQEMEASKQAALARLSQDPRFAGMGDLMQLAPNAVIQQALSKPQGPMVVPAGSSVIDPNNPQSPLFTAPNKPASPSNLAGLIAERDALPQGDPRRQLYDDAITKATTKQPLVEVHTGTKETDKQFAGEFVTFATGGYADIQKQVGQLQEVSKALGSEEGITGPVVGNVPRTVRNVSHPRSVAVQEAVEEVVQRNLRLILGAQFTEKEGERLISRAYNPALPQEENKKRVDRLIKQIQDAAEAKLDASRFFMANRTLDGWRGKLWTMKDFNPEEDSKPNMTSMPPAKDHKGKIIEDSTGKRYKSDGMKWQSL